MKILLRTIIFFTGIAWFLVRTSNDHILLDALAAGLSLSSILSVIEAFAINSHRTLIWLKCIFFFPAEYIRLSISYLIIIEVDEKFLMIQGKRIPGQYQPPGGVYKRFPSSLGKLQDLGVQTDSLMPIDETSKDDLRIRVKGRHIPAFFDWFDSYKNREVGHGREFYEELIEPGHLSSKNFSAAKFEYIKRHNNGIKFSRHSQSQEILVADIVRLLPTENQLQELKDLKNRHHPELLWVTEDEMRRLTTSPRSDDPKTIAPTAIWLLE